MSERITPQGQDGADSAPRREQRDSERIEKGERDPVDAQPRGELRVGVQATDRQIDDVGAGADEEAGDPDREDDSSASHSAVTLRG
ncbi:hypothetical protein ASQ49_00510 [Acidipropionibacterium acidipropionici]|nr:hypothetical protein ASQ49_00510 [Acidipropionibacterium acidipropionici]APZ10258.1 hypothetical protein BWX38_14460 [Acidipropionibacterium acidipropionici]